MIAQGPEDYVLAIHLPYFTPDASQHLVTMHLPLTLAGGFTLMRNVVELVEVAAAQLCIHPCRIKMLQVSDSACFQHMTRLL